MNRGKDGEGGGKRKGFRKGEGGKEERKREKGDGRSPITGQPYPVGWDSLGHNFCAKLRICGAITAPMMVSGIRNKQEVKY